MYIVRDIFHLKFGQFREAKALMNEALEKEMLPKAKTTRILSDFTGDSYRMILETGYDSLADFEKELASDMAKGEWQSWYAKFKEQVTSSHREILKLV